MIRTVVTALAGRMGSQVGRLVGQAQGLELAGATENPAGPWIGRDAGELLGCPSMGVPVRGSLPEALADARASGGASVVIDFSRAELALPHVEACAASPEPVPMILATTGLTPEQSAAVRRYADRVPLLIAPNMSTGVNLLLALVEEAARALGPEFDIEIAELHHRFKRDAPSGTALALGEAAARGRGTALANVARMAREGLVGERPPGEIGIQALRGGDVAGEHTVYFFGEAERVELTHRVTSREPLARGALRAARFMAGRPPGLYTMGHVLGAGTP